MREGDETGILNDYTRNGSIIFSVDEKKTRHSDLIADPGLQPGLLVDQGPVVRKVVVTNCPLISLVLMHTPEHWLLHI